MFVLIVEDDPLFAEILQTYLDDKECTTMVVQTIAEAIEIASTQQLDIVLLDNHLPDGRGIEHIKEIKWANTLPTPVTVITGDDNFENMKAAFDNGVDDYLVKPIPLELMWRKMQRMRRLYSIGAKLDEQAKRLALLVNKQEQEEQLARHVYEHVTSGASVVNPHIDTCIQSSNIFNGDMFFSMSAPNGNYFVILADATGHGLSAAICILPLFTTMRAMIRKGLSLAHIVHEANNKLCKKLPDDKFAALIAIEVDCHKEQIQVFNGGMPNIYCIDANGRLDSLGSTSMALGILPQSSFDPGIETIDANKYEHLFFYSDGIIEQENDAKEQFGDDRLRAALQSTNNDLSIIERVRQAFDEFNQQNELQDDLSFCDLQVNGLIASQLKQTSDNQCKKSGKLIASITIEGQLLSSTDIMGVFDGLMKCLDLAGDLRQKAFTVFAELISNAFDHGILDLDSSLKNDVDGFAEYLSLKEQRSNSLKDTDKLEIQLAYYAKNEQIEFSITDSGKGYNAVSSSQEQNETLSGRGLALINKLCKQVAVTPPGNATAVVLERDD